MPLVSVLHLYVVNSASVTLGGLISKDRGQAYSNIGLTFYVYQPCFKILKSKVSTNKNNSLTHYSMTRPGLDTLPFAPHPYNAAIMCYPLASSAHKFKTLILPNCL